jgi:hypothetical protein
MRQPPTPPPLDPAGLPAVALLLHTAVPTATDHPYRPLASPASAARHLARRHHLEFDGEHAELFTDQATLDGRLRVGVGWN